MARDPELERCASAVVDVAIQVHRGLGSGLLESVYETVLADQLRRNGFHVERQKAIPLRYENVIHDEAFRADLVIDSILLVELKAVERLLPLHGKQLLTYLRLMQMPLGLLINFGGATAKEGIQRIINTYPMRLPPTSW